MVIAATSGFRGGRIFPSVFAGVAIGLFVNALVPQIPEAIAVSASLMGILAGGDAQRLARDLHGRA